MNQAYRSFVRRVLIGIDNIVRFSDKYWYKCLKLDDIIVEAMAFAVYRGSRSYCLTQTGFLFTRNYRIQC